MHFPAGKASHTPITGKKENCPKGESTKDLPLLQETGTANSLAELSASAELGFSKVSAVGQKWREKISQVRLFSLKTKWNREIKLIDQSSLQSGISLHEKLQGCSHFLTFPNKDAILSLRSLSVQMNRYRAFILVHISFQQRWKSFLLSCSFWFFKYNAVEN